MNEIYCSVCNTLFRLDVSLTNQRYLSCPICSLIAKDAEIDRLKAAVEWLKKRIEILEEQLPKFKDIIGLYVEEEKNDQLLAGGEVIDVNE